MIIKGLEQDGFFCPTSWNFFTDGGRAAYIRYRGGLLSLDVRTTGESDPPRLENGEPLDWAHIYSVKVGGRFDGFIKWDEVFDRIKDLNIEDEIGKYVVEANEHYQKMKNPGYRRQYWYEWAKDFWQNMADTSRELNEKGYVGKDGAKNYEPSKQEIEDKAAKYAEEEEARWQEINGS